MNVSRSGTPVNGLESAMVHAPSATEKIPVVDSTTKADEKVDDKPNDNNNNVQNGVPADAGNVIVPDQQPSRSPDILVDAPPSPRSEDVKADEGLAQEEGVKEGSKTIIDLPVSGFKSAAVNGLDNPDEAKTNGEINYSNDNHVVAEKVDANAKALETEETDKGQYVGDSSWEEKTWKELVRLREDMFWARVGGIRG